MGFVHATVVDDDAIRADTDQGGRAQALDPDAAMVGDAEPIPAGKDALGEELVAGNHVRTRLPLLRHLVAERPGSYESRPKLSKESRIVSAAAYTNRKSPPENA